VVYLTFFWGHTVYCVGYMASLYITNSLSASLGHLLIVSTGALLSFLILATGGPPPQSLPTP